MKHIKKFNESSNIDDLLEISEHAFSDLIDDQILYIEKDHFDNIIGELILLDEKSDNIDDLFKQKETNFSRIKDLKIGIQRIREYYDINLTLENINNKDSNIIFIISFKQNKEVFYKLSNDYVLLYKNLLLKEMKIEKEVKTGISTDGSFDYLTIEFKNGEDFNFEIDKGLVANIYKPKLNQVLSEIKIGEEKLFKSVDNVNYGNQVTKYINGNKITKSEWSVSFKLNNKFDFSMKTR